METAPPQLVETLGLTPEEEQEIEEAAFYEELLEEFDLGTEEALAAGMDFSEFDAEMMRKAMGTFDKASAYYSDDAAKLLAIVDRLGATLEMLGCSHDHFKDQIAARMGGDEAADDRHVHDHGGSHDGGSAHNRAKTVSGRRAGYGNHVTRQRQHGRVTLFDLIMKYFPARPRTDK